MAKSKESTVANDILNHLCHVMVKLDAGKIKTDEALAQSRMAQTAANFLNYELKRSSLTSQPLRENETDAFKSDK
jgi:hypothetical protein